MARPFDEPGPRRARLLYVGRVRVGAPEEIAAALRVAGELGLDRIVSNQPQLQHAVAGHRARGSCRCARRKASGQIVFSPIAQGVLTGKYEPGAPAPGGTPGPPRPAGSGFIKRWLRDDTLAAVQRLRPLADEAGLVPGAAGGGVGRCRTRTWSAAIGGRHPARAGNTRTSKAAGGHAGRRPVEPDRRGPSVTR